MRPEDIQGRDFLVVLRGYDRDDVRSFLAQVAAEHAALLTEVDEARSKLADLGPAADAPARDDFEDLGASVASILRAAKESAGEARRQADAETDELRAAAQAALDDAKRDAELIVREASDRARQLELETEARLNDKVVEATRREDTLRARLLEANDELQLALMALDGVGVEPAPPSAVEPDAEADAERPAPTDSPSWS